MKNNEEKKPIYKKWWFWVIIIVIIACVSNPEALKEGMEEGMSNTTNKVVENKVETEEMKTNEIVNNKTEEIVFLEGTKGKEYFEILTEVAGIKQKTSDNTQDLGNSIMYEVVNDYYSIEVCTKPDTDEIGYIRLMVFKEDTDNNSENLFMALSRLNYNGSSASEVTKFISNNYGKTSSTKIGDLTFNLTIGTSGKPILECKTDGFDNYIISD